MEVSPELQARFEQLAKLPKAARAGILVVVAVAIGAGYFFGVYQGKSEQVQALRAKELELQRKLTEVRSIVANMAAFEEEITALEEELAVALLQLPNQKQLEVLLTDISNLGKTAGVEIKSFQRESELVHDFYAEVPIAIELEGKFHDIAKFFELVPKPPRIVNLASIAMSVAADNEFETRVKVKGTATTFRFVGNG
jgi:type IV pilus assembly protein PilO